VPYDRLFIWQCKRCYGENVAFVRSVTEPGEALRLTCEQCGWEQRKEFHPSSEREPEGCRT